MLDQQDIEILKNAILPELKKEIRDTLVEQRDNRWIKGLPAASKAGRIHRDELRKLLKDGTIRGYRREDGIWIVDRYSLDAYHEQNIKTWAGEGDLLEKKIIDFLTRSG